MTDLLYRRLQDDPLADNLRATRDYVGELAKRYQFFHWHVAFPHVFHVDTRALIGDEGQGITGWDGGFDCVLGNPPWERIKIQEKEWFAQRNPDIANAPNAAARKRLIDTLKNDPTGESLYRDFQADLRAAEGESHYVRVSGRYPLCGRGDVNTYTIFAESSRQIISGMGRVGMIVPSGIATDDTTKFFFQDLMETGSLSSLHSFENEEHIFPNIHNAIKFCLLTLHGLENPVVAADFVFFARQVNHLTDIDRHFSLSANDIFLLSPNTHTCLTFRSHKDAEITKAIANSVPILQYDDSTLKNYWRVSFMRMFDMANSSHLFRNKNDFSSSSLETYGYHFIHEGHNYVPLYEAKLMHQFDHRYATYENATQAEMNAGRLPQTSSASKQNPAFYISPQYWIELSEIDRQLADKDCRWLFAFRKVARSVDERTVIAAFLPKVGVGDTAPLIFVEHDEVSDRLCLLANLNSLIHDYIARQKVGGTAINHFIIKQFNVIPPHTYTAELLDFIVPRVLELTYTAWDLQPFAQDVGYDGAPFIWDEERRFLMRCELDALYFHLYQISRDDADYILETFPIVKRKDEAAWGEYRTKRVILEMYDQMAALPPMHVPAPKGEGAYAVPDVRGWVTWLEPGAGDARVGHLNT